MNLVRIRGPRSVGVRLPRPCPFDGPVGCSVADFDCARCARFRDPTDVHVNPRTLVFVDHPTDAGRLDPSIDIIVLDTSWTPDPGDRPDLVSIRPALTSVLRRVDLFDGSLARLDAWADAAELADRFTVDGVTWWFRVRMIVRWDLHELMLWRHVLDEVAPHGRYQTIVVPASRRALVHAARATSPSLAAPRVRTVGGAVGRVTGLLAWGRRQGGRAYPQDSSGNLRRYALFPAGPQTENPDQSRLSK